MKNVLIEGTGVYIPKNKVYNDDLEAHFNKIGLTARGLMKHLGRRKRYFISEGETSISMAQNAIDDCIRKNYLKLSDYEMIVFCSDTPEYLSPSNAMRITGLAGDKMKNIRVAFDLNSNCTSMIQAMDVVSKYMVASDIKKALVVGSFCMSPIALWSDTVVYATFGDAAACVALCLKEERRRRGILDTNVFIDASFHDYVKYPKCGMAKTPLMAVYPNEKRLEWIPFDMDFISQKMADAMKDLLSKNSLAVEDINHFVFSQLSDAYNTKALELLGVEQTGGKYNYVGTEYGYTGNTCPILCMDRMWHTYSKKGNKVLICTFGAGYSLIVMLVQF